MPSTQGENQHPQLAQLNSTGGSVISGGTIMRMLFYTFLMVTFPISSYFISKKYFYEGFFGYTEDDSIIPSALTAVVMVHVVLALFIYAAYTEDIPKKKKQA